jgi:hypothetical protein
MEKERIRRAARRTLGRRHLGTDDQKSSTVESLTLSKANPLSTSDETESRFAWR